MGNRIKKTYSKSQAINAARKFIKEVRQLEEKFGLTFNSNSDDVFLSFKKRPEDLSQYEDHYGSIRLGWVGDGSGIKVME